MYSSQLEPDQSQDTKDLNNQVDHMDKYRNFNLIIETVPPFQVYMECS